MKQLCALSILVLGLTVGSAASSEMGFTLGGRPVVHYVTGDDFDSDFDSDNVLPGVELYAQWWVREWFAMEVHAGYFTRDDVDMDIEGFDVIFGKGEGAVRPYFKAGVITGGLDIDDVDGDFDRDFGWEAGVGLGVMQPEGFSMSIELLWRDIEFDFDFDKDFGIFGSDQDLKADMAGVTLSFGFNYRW